MDGDTLLTIGALARRTGLTVKTIRFWSDAGIVPPTDRSPAGYRLYDIGALARLDLARTLRDLGLDLAVIRRVLDREVSVPEVAAAHADALEVQIRTLRLRRAVLRAVAKKGSTPEETELMHKLATLSDAERRSLIDDFIDATFGGLDANADFVEMLRSAGPELPDDPEPDQVDAWIELAELTRDGDFRAAVRRMAEYQAAERARGDATGLHHELTEAVREAVGRSLAAGVAPESPEAAAVVDGLTARYARTFDRPDDSELRHWLLDRLEIAGDPRTERYWHLLAVVNGWPVPPGLAPVFTWFTAALRARTGP
ncbi:MerR family transcriptional regulator [Kitasatospora sp. DSM 101779]|uniref:MerR family transcriptional regulator n=1 Tax=Kitasatospora sp. DSM 101779 TaxID=2853165 RepID=UPI0021D8FD13|nr:MerR family transcriptional regulator [Kitasatospora sp. DSM 101779]MCU7826688.1 MerR family transcriptional regulator [Kitasatospora sp. DSM 101779]